MGMLIRSMICILDCHRLPSPDRPPTPRSYSIIDLAYRPGLLSSMEDATTSGSAFDGDELPPALAVGHAQPAWKYLAVTLEQTPMHFVGLAPRRANYLDPVALLSGSIGSVAALRHDT
jgi:hypothetical protein